MTNQREKKLWYEIGWLRFLLAIFATLILGMIYLGIWKWDESVWRDLFLSVIGNIIPVPLIFILAYIAFRRIEELRSEKDSDDLADKVILRLLDIAKIQTGTSLGTGSFLDEIPEISETYLKLSRELDVTVKPFESKSNPQKIIIECNYRGTSNIHIRKITYSGSKLSTTEDISDIYKLDGSIALIVEDKIDLLSGHKHNIELVLAKKTTRWNKTIESWYGKLGYLHFEIEYGNEVIDLQKAI